MVGVACVLVAMAMRQFLWVKCRLRTQVPGVTWCDTRSVSEALCMSVWGGEREREGEGGEREVETYIASLLLAYRGTPDTY